MLQKIICSFFRFGGHSQVNAGDERHRAGGAGHKSSSPAFASSAATMNIDNRTLSLFADGMARCLAAGLPPRRALELSRFDRRSKAMAELIRVARQRCDQGMSVAEALEPGRKVLPYYFLPVIRAGEAGGRLVEAFQLLYQHCQRIAPSVRLVRKTWLYPLILVMFGWIIRIGIFLYFGRPAAAAHFFWSSFGAGSLLVLAGWLLLKLASVKAGIDRLLLQLPVVRETELGLGRLCSSPRSGWHTRPAAWGWSSCLIWHPRPFAILPFARIGSKRVRFWNGMALLRRLLGS